MDDESKQKKSSKNEIVINNLHQTDKINKKESKSFKIAKHNKDKFLSIKYKSNLNTHHRNYINSVILLNNRPKYKSQIFKIHPKFMKDKIFFLNLASSKKISKDKIIKLKKPSKNFIGENNKNNEILLNSENYDNLPSFTKELQKALYSKSDIDSFDNRQSKNMNKKEKKDSSKRTLSEKDEKENNSSQNCESESEEISDGPMHEDNKTLMDVIGHKSIHKKNSDKIEEGKVKLKNKENENNEIVANEEKNNYNYTDLLLPILTTIPEVEKIQSNIENAHKILSTNPSTIDSTLDSINLNNSNNNSQISKDKKKSLDITNSNLILQEKNQTEENNNNNDKSINKIEKDDNDLPNSTKKRNSLNTLNMPIIMVPSSLEKDIRTIYKFKGEPLGDGNFGQVRKAYRKDDKEKKKYFAIKSISKKNLAEKDFTNLIKEVNIISGLSHPNIVNFYETYHDKHYFHIVMELCEGNDSYQQIVKKEKCDEKKVVSLIAKVLLGIAHCHSRGVTHRDLKPENILYESNSPDAEIKIIDFGLSRKYSKDVKLHSVLGTPYYVAPEVLKGSYDQKCDIRSIGAMTYLLLCGKPPFNGSTDKEIFNSILNSDVKFDTPIWNNVSNNAKSFVRLCLEKNSAKRPNVIKALDHPWFTNVLNATHRLQNLREDILINIKNYNIKKKFKQMIIKHLLTSMNRDELKIYKNVFFAIDFTHNGCIEPHELKKAFELKKIAITEEEINHLFKIMDQNLKGAIDFTEFLMAGFDREQLFTNEKLTKAFNYFDINNSGFIENKDLYDNLLRNGKQCINTNDINFFIYDALKDLDDKKGYDKDSEIFKKVSIDDFMKIFKNN